MPDSTTASRPSAAAVPQSVFKVVIKGSIHDVWREITRTDAPIQCFFNSRMHIGPAGLKPGSKIAMRSPDGRNTGVVGRILECNPPHRLSHTFKFTNYNDPECTVTYDLREVAEGTEFTLTIGDLPVGTKTAKQMVQGGKFIVNTLKGVIETGRAPLGSRVIFTIIKLTGPLTPKKCRSEHWPVT